MEDGGDGNDRQISEFPTWKHKIYLLATFAIAAVMAIAIARITKPLIHRAIIWLGN